ncbi:MAG: sensor histidine kinase [Ferruginibacter sp.]
MEFDNDRIRKHANKIEIFYWVLLGMINPLVNSLNFFTGEIKIWPLLLLVNILILPAYLFYAVFIVPRFLFKNRYRFFALTSLSFFIVLHLLLFSVYSLILQFNLTPNEQVYFSYNYGTIARECLWMLINMSLAAAIAFIKKGLDEKDLMVSLQKDNIIFKLKYLRAQLNPHFLFNTLNSIYSLSLQKSDKAPELVVKLADLMRYMIYECNEDKVPLNKEIEFIQNYIEIEKIRYKADVRFSVEGKTDGVMIEPFLFISFIENGFKHAFDNSFTEPFIYITIKVEPEQIVLNVINNTNIDLETQAKRISGTGITNSKTLLELLYPDAHALNIIQTEKEEARKNILRIKNAKQRLETFYPDSHTLDVILSNNAFTVSLIIKPRLT